jgi:hypothetical protein
MIPSVPIHLYPLFVLSFNLTKKDLTPLKKNV